jgi:LysR family glycine cleavage system transcriptional activator
MYKLSHLNSLLAFEASARHLSFALAAKELNVTPAAVGQLVRQLEHWLGINLFHRANSGPSRLTLTYEAKRALPKFSKGFEYLAAGIAVLKQQQETTLTVSVSPAFAAKWLLPRIDRFQTDHPEIDLRLDTNIRLLDYRSEGIDIGVRYGRGQWPGLSSLLLMKEDIYPVCSPRLVEQGLNRPEDLANFALLHDTSLPAELDFPSWPNWFQAMNISFSDSTKGLKINNSASVIQAAINGQGVALGRSVLAADDLNCGSLVRPFSSNASQLNMAYYAVWQPGNNDTKIAAFKHWLQQQCNQSS